MNKHSVLYRFGMSMTVLALAAFLWGCGQTVPTGVDLRDISAPTGHDDPTDGGESNDPDWW